MMQRVLHQLYKRLQSICMLVDTLILSSAYHIPSNILTNALNSIKHNQNTE